MVASLDVDVESNLDECFHCILILTLKSGLLSLLFISIDIWPLDSPFVIRRGSGGSVGADCPCDVPDPAVRLGGTPPLRGKPVSSPLDLFPRSVKNPHEFHRPNPSHISA